MKKRRLVYWLLMRFSIFRSAMELLPQLEESRKKSAIAENRIEELLSARSELLAQVSELELQLGPAREAHRNVENKLIELEGRYTAMVEFAESRAQDLHKTVDFFALSTTGRQVFGTSPHVTVTSTEPEPESSPVSGRALRENLVNQGLIERDELIKAFEEQFANNGKS